MTEPSPLRPRFTVRFWHIALALFLAGPLAFLLVVRTGGLPNAAAPRPPAPAAPGAGALETAKRNASASPGLEAFLELSYQYYLHHRFEESITAAQQALEIDPKSDRAYNNICAACNKLGKWDGAIEACRNALRINPEFQLAKNNLAWALGGKAKASASPPPVR